MPLLLFPCEAGCRRQFRTLRAMQTHLTMAKSCEWYMKGKFREWEMGENEEVGRAEEYGSLAQEDFVLGDEGSIAGNYDPEDDDNLCYDEGDLGPSDFHFIPREQDPTPEEMEGEQGPGPQTAAHRIQWQAHRVLNDDSDDRVTDTHPLAGRISWKESPPRLRSEEDMDVDRADNENNPFYPFNSELDWKVAQWAVKDNPGHNAFDRLLAVPGVGVMVYLTLPTLILPFPGC